MRIPMQPPGQASTPKNLMVQGIDFADRLEAVTQTYIGLFNRPTETLVAPGPNEQAALHRVRVIHFRGESPT